ncbi:unnamed protein product [Ixodes hexagonus]
MAPNNRLRAATYLSPGIPVELYESILHYLEGKLDITTSLLYESRWYGPPADRPDPFAQKEVDIAFMSPIAFVRLTDSGASNLELLPASTVHKHRLGDGSPGHYSDLIINADLVSSNVTTFEKLRGCKWAFTGPESFSGHQVTLQELKKRGETANFFGNKLQARSHLDSIYMVLNKQVDAAAVDANCLALFLDRNPFYKDKIYVIESWGALPPYPIGVRKDLDPNLKAALLDALLQMHNDPEGAKKLKEFRVERFAPVQMDQFLDFKEELRATEKLTFATVYY